MNYRHAFHAGNHGDVLKHVVLARVMTYLTQKDAPLAVLDTHAGIGRYDLSGVEAFKTGEWRGGIGRVLGHDFSPEISALLEPYLATVRALNTGGVLQHYPGSPEILCQIARAGDRVLLNELHPQDFETLALKFGGDRRVRCGAVDAAQAVKALLPFAERRGLVLIDPAFEVIDESARVARMVVHALQRMAPVCIAVWYPVTAQAFADAFCAGLDGTLAKAVLRAELTVRLPVEGRGLCGSGLVVFNPPWVLHDELRVILPALLEVLRDGPGAGMTLTWIKPPT